MLVKTIIHAHFYQPPREDPWTDLLEEQPSLYPYKNWNEKITKECYGPNASSRVLDFNGKIRLIINNYRYISFNFGPTLLQWLEKEEPETYNAILEADRLSINEHKGHGNAIAQIYNHVIMPLQSFEDKKTEIIWGLKDFEYRFKRKSEGIWLPETAVDYKTIDLLIENGIKFIILSSDQAESYRHINEKEWKLTKDKPIDTTRVYKIIRSHGEIAVFYYNKEISNAISFGHLLRNSDNFAQRIISSSTRAEHSLVTIATDGEVYGHHEPFGDMCLASLINNYNGKEIKLMNFGEYLEEFKPEYETEISLGEDGIGSSWSCFHGVGRWYKDCGCHTGGESGWNQKWRKPLREALDIVKEYIDKKFVTYLKQFFDEPFEIRNRYIEHILNNYDISNLSIFRNSKKEINDNELTNILRLLEAEKFMLFAYTSCGWFFSDISGIETIQNLRYAYKSITLLEDFSIEVLDAFEKKLAEANSNISKYRNGKFILENFIYPEKMDFYKLINNIIGLYRLNRNFKLENFKVFQNFSYKNLSIHKIDENSRFFDGKIDVFDKKINQWESFFFIYNLLENNDYRIYITKFVNREKLILQKDNILNNNYNGENEVVVLSLKDLTKDVKQYLLEMLDHDKLEKMFKINIVSVNDILNILNDYKNTGLQLPSIIYSIVKLSFEVYFYEFSKNLTDFPTKSQYFELIKIFDYINYYSIKVDLTILKNKLSEILFNKLSNNQDAFSNVYSDAVILIQFCNKVGLVLEKSKSENIIYRLLKNETNEILRKMGMDISEEDKTKYMMQYRRLIILAETFNINTDEEKAKFFQNLNTISEKSFFDI